MLLAWRHVFSHAIVLALVQSGERRPIDDAAFTKVHLGADPILSRIPRYVPPTNWAIATGYLQAPSTSLVLEIGLENTGRGIISTDGTSMRENSAVGTRC